MILGPNNNALDAMYTWRIELSEYLQRIEGWNRPVPSVKELKIGPRPEQIGECQSYGRVGGDRSLASGR